MAQLKRRSMRNALGNTMSLLDDGRMRGFTAADIFGAFAQIVANQSPTLARKSFEALEKVIHSRAMLPEAREVSAPTVIPEEAVDIADRERVAIWMMSQGYVTGHGDTIEDLLGELEAQARSRGARHVSDIKSEAMRGLQHANRLAEAAGIAPLEPRDIIMLRD